jgi:hypothetical protein
MKTYTFSALMKHPEGVGTWTYIDIPHDITLEWGVKGQARVKGTLNGTSFHGVTRPHGDGTHYLAINQAIREEVGIKPGDTVQVSFEQDLDPIKLVMPEDFAQALQDNPEAEAFYNALSNSHQREYLKFIEEAKQTATRQKRIQQTIEMLVNKNSKS